MAESLRLPGLQIASPAAALALYGIVHLLGEDAAVCWSAADGCAEVRSEIATVDELCERLVSNIEARRFTGLGDGVKDVNEIKQDVWMRLDDADSEVHSEVPRLVAGLCAEAPLRDDDRTALTPLCVYSFGTRGTLIGNAVKQDASLNVKALRAVLMGPWTPRRDVNTLGFDPGARRQEGAIMGPDPSADGVRGVPGLVPLALRGLAAVAPMPRRVRVGGGAFSRADGQVRFLWPMFTVPVGREALPAMVARNWGARTAAQRAAASVEAVYAADILRAERRLSLGRRVA